MKQATIRDMKEGKTVYVRGYGAVRGRAKVIEVFKGIFKVRLDRDIGYLRHRDVEDLLVRN